MKSSLTRILASCAKAGRPGIFPICLALQTLSLAAPAETPGAQPGDEMIQSYLRHETQKIEPSSPDTNQSFASWNHELPRWRQEYFEMLGLWPMPDRTPLHATVTGNLDRGDYVVDLLHFQSRPGLYVTANLYRPAQIAAGARLPAILYVCGHSQRGRDGNKTAYQSHGIWFARHGYICLTLDTLQLGEIAGIHHGTYREGRWWWLSRGYTSAGVECWNGMRGIDYLVGRPDVDPDRIGVTGISGGGAASFWISAADTRVRAAAPVSGMSDLQCYVSQHVVDGHCDCMFLYNTYQWPWTRILSLVAPRPLLFVNSDQDSLFPMDGNDRVINQLERSYSLFGAGDMVDSVVSIGGHAYRADIRKATFRFFNTHLKNDPRPILDSEVDLVTGSAPQDHPIAPERLRVFSNDSDVPKDAINDRVDRGFVPMASPTTPSPGQFDTWKADLLAKLRRMTFPHFPERIPSAVGVQTNSSGTIRLATESEIFINLVPLQPFGPGGSRIWILSANDESEDWTWLKRLASEQDGIYRCEARGIGISRWTRRDPPNYVERAHYLLGRTVDSGRVWDLAATARFLKEAHAGRVEVGLAGAGTVGVDSAYAALLETDVARVALFHTPASHMEDAAPALLNVLRVCDIPDVLGMLAPRPVILVGPPGGIVQRVSSVYNAAGAARQLSSSPN